MVRIAAKACRSCSAPDAAASLSTCALSLARNRLAGCTRSPRSASTRVTGCWASQSICRSGWWARNASAIATSRRAWPSPIAEETNSARRRRLRAGVRVRRTGVGGARESANPATSRVNRTGSRSGMPVPRAGHGDEVPPVRSATRTPASHGTISSRSPCTTSTGHATARHTASASARAEPGPGGRRRVEGRGVGLQRPADPVLPLLGRVRLGEHPREERLGPSAVVHPPGRARRISVTGLVPDLRRSRSPCSTALRASWARAATTPATRPG